MAAKPIKEILEYYESEPLLSFIEETFQLDRQVFVDWVEKPERHNGEMIHLHITEYILYKAYNSTSVLAWLKAIEEAFGNYVVLEWEK